MNRLLDKVKRRFRSPSPSPRVKDAGKPLATSASQVAVSASVLPSRPHTSHSETSAIRAHGPSLSLTHSGNVTIGGNLTAASSSDHASPCSSDRLGSPLASVTVPIVRVSFSEPDNSASSSVHAAHSPTPISEVQAPAKIDMHATAPPQTRSTLGSDVTEPSLSAVVWAKTLEIAKQKLSDQKLPPLDLTNLTAQSAEENINAIVRALNILQEDDEKKRWSYTWRGKKVLVAERLGKILKRVERYSKVVCTAVQSNPEVAALVWASVWTIMQACV